MKFIKIIATLFSIVVTSSLYSGVALADNFIECYACTDTEKLSIVNTWAVNNISESEANQNKIKDVHVVDIFNNVIRSFRVSLKLTPVPPPLPANYLPNSVIINTPHYLKEPMSQLKVAKRNLRAASNELIIPTSEISDAWQFTKCAFCENNVERFINNSLSGEITTVQMTIATLAQTFGLIKTGLPNTFVIKLEAGGQLDVMMTLNNKPISINVTVIKAVDPDGNTVPFSETGLRNLLLQISTINRANTINDFIFRFNFMVPLKMGFVTIDDCPKVTKENPTPEPCG
ncbi:hypothetical protein [Pseudoalteromonas denitrificans]|uniref:Uncharacterized protein n=1 Tax=Pseudoalteromonas denitrificans DSM 6059 TaxID=1123010 RepID=A0A1I1VA15_9GAMM|nr:hypothetical protein [Pseudoalteromonas denitrificans]SFD79817.1 hypothetical protein SAMN02745724_05453 [Pseudoalteromonas denitrificans DSM 6059]